MPGRPAASAAAVSWYVALSSLTARAKLATGPPSTAMTDAEVGLPRTLGAHGRSELLPASGRGEEVASIIRDRGGEAVANYDDVADFKASNNIIDQAVEAFGRLDIVVNNAGILRDKMIFSMSEDEFDSVIRVHLKGTWCMTRHASAYWREQSKAGDQPRAAIVNTVSSAGLQG